MPDLSKADPLLRKLPWRRLVGASGTLIGTTVSINLLRVINTVILTRLLSPRDFGLIGIIMSIFFVINMVTDAGFQSFIVRHKLGLDADFLDAIWTVHVARGAMNAAAVAALAFPLAHVLAKQELAPLLAVAALTLAIDGSTSLSLMTALREKMVRKLSLVDFSVFLIQFVSGLVAAWLLRSVWAIIVAMFLASVARSAASYLIFPNASRRFRYDREIARELWHFSRLIAASSTLTLVISQVDKLILARMFSLLQFGVYSVSANLASAPVSLANMYSSRIVYPILAESWQKERSQLPGLYYEIRGIVFYGYLVGAGVLIGAAPLVVRILYDARYQEAGLYLRLLAITTALTMLTKQMNDLLVVTGRVRVTLEVNIVRAVWLVFSAACGLVFLGSFGLILALALIELPAYLYSAWRLATYRLYSAPFEVIAFIAILGGVSAGLLANLISRL